MYDFIKEIKEKSKKTESLFLIGLDEENSVYSFKMLQSLYDLKKYAKKVNNTIQKPDSKFFKNRELYLNSVSLFLLRLNYTHMIFTNFISIVVIGKFDKTIYSYSDLTNHKQFKHIFDTTEQEILIKFNSLRNIIVHSAYAELFLDLDETDFKEFIDLINRICDLEKVIMHELRRNSLFSPHSHNGN